MLPNILRPANGLVGLPLAGRQLLKRRRAACTARGATTSPARQRLPSNKPSGVCLLAHELGKSRSAGRYAGVKTAERPPRNRLSDTRSVCSIWGLRNSEWVLKTAAFGVLVFACEDEEAECRGHSAEGPTPQIPRGGGDVGVSTLALEFAGGRLDRCRRSLPRRRRLRHRPRRRLCAHAASTGSRSFWVDIQTGFGPFVAIYLTAHAWPQFDIGLVLTAGGLVALACQMPGGALVDAVRSAISCRTRRGSDLR